MSKLFNSSLKCSIENNNFAVIRKKSNKWILMKSFKFSKDIVYAKEFDTAGDFNEKFLQIKCL